MLQLKTVFPLLLLGFVASAPLPTPVSAPGTNSPPVDHITGDYVEVRTASVFAGACHYNGELVTSGREAIMAWKITSGRWKGIDLAGVTAAGSVSSESNLGDDTAARHSEIMVDASATQAQATAMIDLLRTHCGQHLGHIHNIHSSPMTFIRKGRACDVHAAGFADLSVQPMPNDECCTQPSMVWYSPLIHLDHRKVGFTQSASYSAGTNGDPWERSEENSAFYGSFAF